MKTLKNICVNCGSNPGFDPRYLAAARRLGRLLGARGISLVYGGANVGLMGAVADEVLKAGAPVIGVIPKAFAHRVAHRGLSRLYVVCDMHARKKMMFDFSDAFIGLPGGYGTLDEVFEIMTWAQLGFHRKPCGLLNVGGYYDHLLAFLDHATGHGFVKPAHRALLLEARTPSALLKKLAAYEPATVEKWIRKNQITKGAS